MFRELRTERQNVVVVGDAFVSTEVMEDAVREMGLAADRVTALMWGTGDTNEFAYRQLHIEREGPEAEDPAEGLEEALHDATVLMVHFNPVPRMLIERAPRLRAIFTCRGGIEHIDVVAATELGIPVVHTVRNAVPVAEFALGLMLAATRNIATSHRELMTGRWVKEYPNAASCSTLANMVVGLVGLGNVGIELAVRLRALGVKVLAYDPYISRERLEGSGLADVCLVECAETIFAEADIVSLHMRLTPETEGMVDKRLFALMKPAAFFINTARGGLIVQEDLVEALRARRIAGAALDVFEAEPLPVPNDLMNLGTVTITPHIAGMTVDAIPLSPLQTAREVNKIIDSGTLERVVNAHELGFGA